MEENDYDVSAVENDQRVTWRNYKFIPFPERKKPNINCCNKITFSYLSNIAKDGFYNPPLNFKDVYLAPYYHAEKLFKNGSKLINNHEKISKFNFFTKILSLEKTTVWFTICLNFFDMFAEALRPIILKNILLEISNGDEKDPNKLILLSIAMFIASICVGIGHSQYLNAANNLLGLRWNATLSSLIFSKLLKSHAKRGSNGLNLIIGDCKIIADTSLWSFRFPGFLSVIIYSIVMLFFEIGVGPGLVGVTTLITLLILQWYVGSKQAKYQKRKQYESDQRLGLVREMINSIRGIKFSGWEEQTEDRIHQIRRKEMNSLFGFRALWAINEFLAAIATVGASVLAIITYAIVSPTFNISNVFTAIAFFNLLRQPLQFIPLMISAISKGKTSLWRIKAYLEAIEKEQPNYIVAESSNDVCISLNNLMSGWNEINGSVCEDNDDDAVLKNININIDGPGLYGIIGKVGSGKSTLLSTILRDATVYNGKLKVNGTVAYAPQQAWIMNATIRDNILFGETYNKMKYNQVLDACGLLIDINTFPAGDETEIGEKGVNLSGGQKQRLALARCAYSSAQIMVFDDAFSALDVSVAKQVFEKLILGILKEKTILLVTHYLHLLQDCSSVFVMKEGSIIESGTYDELKKNGNEMINNYVVTQDMDVEKGTEEVKQTSKDDKKNDSTTLSICTTTTTTTTTTLATTKEQKEVTNVQNVNICIKKQKDTKTIAAGKKLIVDEHREKGMVTFKTWIRYFTAFGGWKYFGPIIIASILIEASFATSDWWLTYDEGKSLHIYGFLALCNAFTNVVRVTIFAFGTVRAATVFHDSILQSVISAPVLFFDVNPAGRIIQRFAGDFFDIEVMLPHFLEHAWLCLSHIIGIVLTMCILAPYTIIGLIPIFIFYFNMQKVYSANNRETKRLQSLSQSPMSSLISEAISGREIIRAFQMEKKYELLFL